MLKVKSRAEKRSRDEPDGPESSLNNINSRACESEDAAVSEIIKKVRLGNLPGELRLMNDIREILDSRDGSSLDLRALGPTSIEAIIAPHVLSCQLPPHLPGSVSVTVIVDRFYPHVPPIVQCTGFGWVVNAVAPLPFPPGGAIGGRGLGGGIGAGAGAYSSSSNAPGSGHVQRSARHIGGSVWTRTILGGGLGMAAFTGRSAGDLATLERNERPLRRERQREQPAPRPQTSSYGIEAAAASSSSTASNHALNRADAHGQHGICTGLAHTRSRPTRNSVENLIDADIDAAGLGSVGYSSGGDAVGSGGAEGEGDTYCSASHGSSQFEGEHDGDEEGKEAMVDDTHVGGAEHGGSETEGEIDEEEDARASVAAVGEREGYGIGEAEGEAQAWDVARHFAQLGGGVGGDSSILAAPDSSSAATDRNRGGGVNQPRRFGEAPPTASFARSLAASTFSPFPPPEAVGGGVACPTLDPGRPVTLPILSEWNCTWRLKNVLDGVRDIFTRQLCAAAGLRAEAVCSALQGHVHEHVPQADADIEVDDL